MNYGCQQNTQEWIYCSPLRSSSFFRRKLEYKPKKGEIDEAEKIIIREKLERFGEVVDIYEPQGRGARYSSSGEFIGFLEL